MAKRKPETEVGSYSHPEATRKNIPTAETERFMADEEAAPKKLRWPRNPDLDPQLVWRGKDWQGDLEVPVVPVYIQEKIHPQAIIEDLRRQTVARAKEEAGDTPDLFADFNGLPDLEAKLEFYQHDQHWSNRMILGDSLLVMASLAEKEGLKGKVQMIYMDPPYGIKFSSNWQATTRDRTVEDGRLHGSSREPEVIKAFRDTWSDDTNSYLEYLRGRMMLSHDLLCPTGSFFLQIGNENVHLVRSVSDEVFGRENACALITVSKTVGQTASLLAGVCDYVLWYAKDKSSVKYRRPLRQKSIDHDNAGVYRNLMFPDGVRRRGEAQELADSISGDLEARIFTLGDLTSQKPPGSFPVTFAGKLYLPGKGFWKTGENGFERLKKAGRVGSASNSIRYIRFLDDFAAAEHGNLWTDTGTGSFTETKIYAVQTSSKIIQRCILMTTDPGDLVLDPTCGSGTTSYVAEMSGRRWITVDTSRVALTLARSRLMGSRYAYYLLRDSEAGARKEAEITRKAETEGPFLDDLRQGFVYDRIPHITLKAIANNAEIDVIWETWQATLEPLRIELNRLLGEAWEEWQIPREAKAGWPEPAAAAHAAWWEARIARQKEIDASIARNAEIELIYDRPYEKKGVVRVTGPFTVESLSPHRVLPADEDDQWLGVGEDGANEGGEGSPTLTLPRCAGEGTRAALCRRGRWWGRRGRRGGERMAGRATISYGWCWRI